VANKATWPHNDAGKCVERASYDSIGQLMEKAEYVCGADNCIVEAAEYSPGSEIQERRVYHFDSHGNPVRLETHIKDRVYFASRQNEYDENGRLVSWQYAFAAGSVSPKAVITYDVHGNETEYAAFNPDGTLDTKLSLHYDKEIDVTCRLEYGPSGKIAFRTVWNGRGHRIQAEALAPDGSTKAVDKYEYTCDDQGNWTKKVSLGQVTAFGKIRFEPSAAVCRIIDY
jgi:hypothetical protein